MSAVSQSYPNYLGGLNEQPDELKKPGQLVKAINVIPDPTMGLTRRPGFRLVTQSKQDDEIDVQPDPQGTWFEIELSNQINDDYIYFGNVRRDGNIVIFNQDGVKQAIRYTEDNKAIEPHRSYFYNSPTEKLNVFDDNGDKIASLPCKKTKANRYFKHTKDNPLKYCVSKDHVIFTNPTELPTLNRGRVPSNEAKKKYYSFINLKLIDTDNYNYMFRVFGPETEDAVIETYNYISDIDTIDVDDVVTDYDEDLTLPLERNGPFRFTITPKDPPDVAEDAIIEVEFKGQIVQLKSSDGDGYRNEARYYWSTTIVHPGKGFNEGEEYTITKDKDELGGDKDLDFTFEITEVKKITDIKGTTVKPNANNEDLSGMDAADILTELAKNFEANEFIDEAVVVGNGIYLESQTEFSVSTAEPAVADVMNSQKEKDDLVPIVRVNTVSELPVECRAGFIVQVSNSFDEKNDYFLEYVSESQTIIDKDDGEKLTKADGYWEEIAKPFEPISVSRGTMPHMITIARENNKAKFVFVVSTLKYVKRSAGTSRDNPSIFTDNARITALNYYKNRLFFFTSGGTIISSRAGEIDNLFLNTALNSSPIDPIDLVANSNQRVPLHGSSIVNNGMAIFGDSEQYMLSTNSDLLTSETANITKISNYTFEYKSNPIYLGTNLGFVSSGFSRFYEMTNLYDRGPVDINERSQQIQGSFGQGYNMPVSSREQSMVIVYKSNEDQAKDMYMYRFRQESSQESSQTSWVKWTVDKTISYVSLPRDKMFVFLKDPGLGCKIYTMDATVMDNVPLNNVQVPRFVDGYTTNTDAGINFDTIVEFPTIYARSKTGSDITSNLTIHRVKLSTSLVGNYNLTIDRKGYDTYNLLVEQAPADEYRAGSPKLYGEKVETVPIYTRNKNLTLTITTNYDAPFTLNSMTWEGDYNPPYYKSV